MEGLGTAAAVIAVVELAAKVASLCLKYSSAVKDAARDIDRLRLRIESLIGALEGVHQLLRGPDGVRLEYSQRLRYVLDASYSQLDRLNEKLEDNPDTNQAMRHIRLRALKWPFKSKDVEKILENLQRNQDTISTFLQFDQTYAIALSPLIQL
jgi:hypothetical protein